jgi:hypothetical protein
MTADVSDWISYRNDSLGLALQHPRAWGLVERWMGCAVVSVAPRDPGDVFRANWNLVLSTADDISFDDFVAEQLRRNEAFLTDYALLATEEATVAGREARAIRGSYRQGVFDIVAPQYFVADGDRNITLSGAMRSDDDGDIDALLAAVAQSLELS